MLDDLVIKGVNNECINYGFYRNRILDIVRFSSSKEEGYR